MIAWVSVQRQIWLFSSLSYGWTAKLIRPWQAEKQKDYSLEAKYQVSHVNISHLTGQKEREREQIGEQTLI